MSDAAARPERKRGLAGLYQRLPRSIVRRFGYDLVPYRKHREAPRDVRSVWCRHLGIDLIVDVGANEGQFVTGMRQRGYDGRIVSFEPLPEAYDVLTTTCGDDPRWRGINCALGDTTGSIEMQVAGNSMSSSVLPMLDSHTEAMPESAIVGTRQVRLDRLDAALPDDLANAGHLFLKIDTQGFEPQVLRGASGLIDRIALLELEMSLTPLYAGQDLAPTVMRDVIAMGFEPVWVEQGFTDEGTMRMLQIDGLFVKSGLVNALGGASA